MMANNEGSDLRFQICVVGEKLKKNEDLKKSIEYFGFPIIYSPSGIELINQAADFTTIYILEEFEGDVFTSLCKAGQRILGPTTVMQYARKKEALPNNLKPLYTTSMENLVISFGGFRSRDELSLLMRLTNQMGGKIMKNFSISKTTHLVATKNSFGTEKYAYATQVGIPIMATDWIRQTWTRRHDVNCFATDEELMQYKLLPFVECKLAFIGYQEEDGQKMIELCNKNGGENVDPMNPSCTHIVIADDHEMDPLEYDHHVYILRNEWFWICVQMEARFSEESYKYQNPNSTLTSSFVMPVRGNKRKRLDSVAHQLAQESHEKELYVSEMRNRKSDGAQLSISGSFLDATLSPDRTLDFMSPDVGERVRSPPIDMRTLTPRQQVCHELLQTETNYVDILNTIMTVFKEPLESPNKVEGKYLAPAEIKIIFGNLPPIFDIHKDIRTSLMVIVGDWREDHSIGDVILNCAPRLMKHYPPFINFFEKTKEVLANCAANNQGFYAFLKVCQSKPECGRQALQDLLMRPVQRLPSIILLLQAILKKTPQSNPDHEKLEKAIKTLEQVTMHINEDKRRTEGQVEMFDLINDIENCPPNLLSSHRSLVAKTDMQEVTDTLNKKGGPVTMFLFTDVLEICKKKTKTAGTLKSPANAGFSGTLRAHNKSYKHLDLIPLNHIKRVVDVKETDDWKKVFAIVCWSSKDLKELLYVFVLLDETNKGDFLRTLCRQVANSVCKADFDNILTTVEPQQLDLHQSENSGNALIKALSKTRSKLGRALSMRKTPTKRSLSRAVSTIISPLRHFGTPSNTISTLRLSSVTNLTELDPSCSSLTPSPLPGKKMKSNSFGVSVSKCL